MDNYSNVLEDIIFPSFIRSCEVNVNLEELEQEVYSIQKNNASVEASNYNGYHSPVCKEEDGHDNYNNLTRLINSTKEFSQNTADRYNLNLKFSNLYWWVNINKTYQYNVAHSHYRADLVGTFYLKSPENCGDLVILRKDGSEYGNLYFDRSDMLTMHINPQRGRLYLIPGHLWHYVEASESHDDRISVSFNIYFNHKLFNP